MLRARPSTFQASIYALLFALTISLSGCFGITQPSEDDIRYMSIQHFEQEYPGLFYPIEMTKDNGYKQNDTHYVAEVTIHVGAIQSLESYINNLKNNDDLSAMEKIFLGAQAGLLKLSMPDFKKDDEFEFKRNYLFIKTDNGWMLKKRLEPEA
ncbi:MAG: hypothetical protein U9N57_00095 [Pseudomonadota bacterium]|nr:hypothetical protein [Pseudomonadota bacterium]